MEIYVYTLTIRIAYYTRVEVYMTEKLAHDKADEFILKHKEISWKNWCHSGYDGYFNDMNICNVRIERKQVLAAEPANDEDEYI